MNTYKYTVSEYLCVEECACVWIAHINTHAHISKYLDMS